MRIGVLMGVAFALVLVGTIPAMATWGDSTYAIWRDISALPGMGTSPHGDYDVGTQKCKVCHSVHGAAPNGQALLRSTISEACSYCHITANVSDYIVYGGVIDNYYGQDFQNAHNAGVTGGLTGGCVDCHTVHKAYTKMPVNTWLQAKILKGAPDDGAPSEPNYDPLAGAPDPDTDDTKEEAMSKWCTKCHRSGNEVPYGYYNDYAQNMADYGMGYGLIEYTHIMKDLAADGDIYDAQDRGGSLEPTQVAFASSKACSSCHASNYGDSSRRWPHYTEGARFLISAGDVSSPATATPIGKTRYDGVCLRCHRDGSRGVGLTW